MTKILKMSFVLQFSLRFQSYTYMYSLLFISLWCLTSRSHRYLLQLACNCSPLVKDTDYIGIFIVFVSSVIALLLLCQVLDTFFGTYLLRDYRTHGSQILQYETTYPRDGLPVFRLSIQTTVLDLEADPDCHVLIYIS